MKNIQRLDLKQTKEVWRYGHSSCLIDIEFYKKHSKKKSIDNKVTKYFGTTGDQVDEEQYDSQQSQEMLINSSSVSEPEPNKEKKAKGGTLIIKCIEFDWLFDNKKGRRFMKALANIESVNLFSNSIIRNIIGFFWSYY
jgi:hypothetical protein